MANIIVKDGVVVYEMTPDMKLTEKGVISRYFIDPMTTTENARVVENIFLPLRFSPGRFRCDENNVITPDEGWLPTILTEYRNERYKELNELCDKILKELTASYPAMEVATFDKQETEARALAADGAASTPFLTQLAAARGVDLTTLAGKVVAKSDAFTQMSGQIIGLRQKYEDAIEAAQSIEEISAVRFDFGYPEEDPANPDMPEPTEPEVPAEDEPKSE